jgi:2,4-dienoyl-CoA reductase-like NADH-dependent reductase (Old Yellow Enzyme family)/thioredoxin reductase
MYKKLFSEGRIGNVALKNRLVMAPMGIGVAELDGTPGEDMIAYYEARAIGGAGLIIPEITRVNDVHGASLTRQLSVTEDRHIEPLSKLATALHKHGTKIFIQLHHPGRQALMSEQTVVSASDIPCKYTRKETRALTTDEVKELISQFVDGAVRVRKAGCDGVELHAAHGYILEQFLSPYTNKRTDEYGGSFENRLRIVAEIIAGIRAACGPDFTVGVRLGVEEFLDQTGVTEDYIRIEDGVKIAVALENLGIDFIDVSVGIYETGITSIEPISYPQGWRRDIIQAVKDNVHIPVIGVSVIRDPEVAEKFLEDGVVDFVAMGRSWLADEQWGKKAQEGREKEICKCLSCLRCFESLEEWNAEGIPAECAMNPRMARERKYGELLHDQNNHHVVVVGGGPSGCMAAKTLAERGCKVTLFERGSTLGGTLNLAKIPPTKERIQWAIDYYQYALEDLGVEVKLNTEVNAEMIASMKPDAVILGTGSVPLIPSRITGVSGENVYTVEQVLTGQAGLINKKVALIGAGLTGIETAEFLCSVGCNVTIVDMLDQIAPTACQTNVIDVCIRLQEHGAEFLLGHALKEIKPDSIVLERQADHVEVSVPVEAVVLSLGNKTDSTLADELRAKGMDVTVVGSAIKDGTIAPATRTGFEIGRSLFTEK